MKYIGYFVLIFIPVHMRIKNEIKVLHSKLNHNFYCLCICELNLINCKLNLKELQKINFFKLIHVWITNKFNFIRRWHIVLFFKDQQFFI